MNNDNSDGALMKDGDGIKKIGLGLQGGGAHTAFLWGVLDRLLDEVKAGNLRIQAISGTSGGAISAAVCVYGLIQGPDQAKCMLREFWELVSAQSLWPPNPFSLFFPETSPKRWNVDWTPTAIGIGITEQIFSPYNNLAFKNPLDAIIRKVIPDFDALKRGGNGAPLLFVCATDVNNTARRIFEQNEITVETLLAAACYPTLFQAIEIDKVLYWDGGYLGNPALNPLVDHSDDLLTISINPIDRVGGPPKTSRQILNRINEIGFNAAWVMEMRQILLINKLLEDQMLQSSKYKPKRFHIIRDDAFMEAIGVASKQNPSADFVDELFERGREKGDEWVRINLAKVGVTSSFDVDAEVALRLKGNADAQLRFKGEASVSGTFDREVGQQ
jgi:NTE family protein